MRNAIHGGAHNVIHYGDGIMRRTKIHTLRPDLSIGPVATRTNMTVSGIW